MNDAEVVKREPAWVAEVAREERWEEREWRQWQVLARRFFGDFQVELDRTEIGPYATASGDDHLPFMSELARDTDERPWFEALHRLCKSVAEVRREQGWDV